MVAINKWLHVFHLVGYSGSIGNALLSALSDEAKSFEILSDALLIRSPRTAIKRAMTLRRFVAWMRGRNEEFVECFKGSFVAVSDN